MFFHCGGDLQSAGEYGIIGSNRVQDSRIGKEYAMKYGKKILAILLTALMLLSLSACSMADMPILKAASPLWMINYFERDHICLCSNHVSNSSHRF